MATPLFEARMESVGNPDHGQYAPVSEPCTLSAHTLPELLVKIEAYRDENDLGGGNWVDPKITCGDKVIGWVSYNGRVWDRPGDDPQWRKAKEIKPEKAVKDTPKTCGHCRRGEVHGVHATVMVRGKNRDGRTVAKAYLCDDHLEVEVQDGAEYTVTTLMTRAYLKELIGRQSGKLDDLVRKNTGYQSFEQMCANYPTLRPINADMKLLRAAYELAVGKPAFA